MEYNPKHFKIESEEKSLELAKKISFASIAYLKDSKIELTHNPILVDIKNKKLYGHFAKANSAYKEVEGQEVLVSFQGEHGLIKPEWYGTNNNVPTWNYVVIHLRGRVKTFTDHSSLKDMLIRMSELYEISPMEVPEGLLNAIVGFEISIEAIEGKAKLGQTKSKDESLNVIARLKENGNSELARLMLQALE